MSQYLTPEQEQRLVTQARSDKEGLRDLYRHYFPSIYAYIAYRVGRAQDAEDLTGETFLKALEHLDTFSWQGAQSFGAWLFRIAHNLIRDFQRRNHRQTAPLQLEDLPMVCANTPLPEDVVLQREQFVHLGTPRN